MALVSPSDIFDVSIVTPPLTYVRLSFAYSLFILICFNNLIYILCCLSSFIYLFIYIF